MTDRLRYLLYLNLNAIQAQQAYNKAKRSNRPGALKSAVFNLKSAQESIRTYCAELIRQGIEPAKTVTNIELFDNGR